MNDNRTSSILQRLPIILAVTAASYGLQVHAAPRVEFRTSATIATNAAPADRASPRTN